VHDDGLSKALGKPELSVEELCLAVMRGVIAIEVEPGLTDADCSGAAASCG